LIDTRCKKKFSKLLNKMNKMGVSSFIVVVCHDDEEHHVVYMDDFSHLREMQEDIGEALDAEEMKNVGISIKTERPTYIQ